MSNFINPLQFSDENFKIHISKQISVSDKKSNSLNLIFKENKVSAPKSVAI